MEASRKQCCYRSICRTEPRKDLISHREREREIQRRVEFERDGWDSLRRRFGAVCALCLLFNSAAFCFRRYGNESATLNLFLLGNRSDYLYVLLVSDSISAAYELFSGFGSRSFTIPSMTHLKAAGSCLAKMTIKVSFISF